MRVLVCGSRDWDDAHTIYAVLAGLAVESERLSTLDWDPFVVIHGAARGADTAAANWAARFVDTDAEAYPADWKGHGRAAGHVRNQRMLDEGKPDVVYAFKDNFDWSLKKGGTEDMVKRAKAAGVPVYVVSRA